MSIKHDLAQAFSGAFGELPPPGPSPLTVAVSRGPLVESRHQVICAVVDPDGEVIAGWGDTATPVYARSAIKALQALPIVESGAADAFAMTDAELALACASHNGEPAHVATATGLVRRIGLTLDDYECGTHWPMNEAAVRAMAAAGEIPGPAHNNCSGKHAGFLATARHLGEPTKGYVLADHPVQVRVRRAMAEMCGVDLTDAPTGIDGCSIPTVAIPLAALARGIARFGCPDGLERGRAEACRRLARAIRAEPFMIAGTGRFCTEAIAVTGGQALVKTGAEGVFMAAIPDRSLGIALKALDGATRAAESAMAALLDRLGLLDRAAIAAVAAASNQTLKNRNGLAVGRVGIAETIAF